MFKPSAFTPAEQRELHRLARKFELELRESARKPGADPQNVRKGKEILAGLRKLLAEGDALSSPRELPSTSLEFLDAIRIKLGNVSDYRVAAELGVTRATVSSWRQGKTRIGDDQVAKVSQLLGLTPEYVIATLGAERAKRTDQREIWERLAQLAKNAGPLILAAIALFAAPETNTHASPAGAHSLYILLNRRRRSMAVAIDRRRGDRRRRRSQAIALTA